MRAKLSELGAVITGNTPSKQEPKYWASSDIPFIKPDVINQDGITEVQAANDYISEMARSKARIAEKNVVLVTCIGTIGKVCLTGKECAFNQQINAIVPNDKVLPEYLAYCIYYNRPKLIELANAPVVPIINKRQFEDFSVNIEESIERQGSIVTILKEVDRLIYYRQQQLQKLDDLVKARFVELFGDPIANPLGWPVKRLDDISVLITNGNTPKGGRDNYVSEGIVFLRSQNVWRNKIDLDYVAYIDAATHADMAKSSLHDKDILITKTGRINTENSSLGRAALFRGADNSANINGHVYLVRLDRTTVPEYVVAILTGEPYRRYIRKVCVGGIDKRQINLDQVEDFPIILPPMELQEQFAAFVAQTDKSKAAIQKALDEAQLLFDSLMQKYFG